MKTKTLVAYYSRTGNTKKVGEKIAKNLKADLDEIVDLKNRKRNLIGWIIAGKDAFLKRDTKIMFKKYPENYDCVIIGTPIWAGTITPAIRTYLKQNPKMKKVAFFCTCGGSHGNVFKEMEKLSKKPVDVLLVKEREISSSDDKIRGFLK